jgi:hypothetical protein
MVILPELFRPPVLFIADTRDFKGVDAVNSSKLLTIFFLCPGVVGFIFITAIFL